MRATREGVVGGIAADEVKGAFGRIGWGAVSNPEPHDLGTDLWIAVRDQDRVDLGIVVGAQVRGGESRFKEKVEGRNGEMLGWWHRDSIKHFDYWSTHAAPHLLILYDLVTRTSYWVHVTADKVKRARTRCKIFVPADQTVSPECFDQLLSVSLTQRSSRLHGGDAWSAGSQDVAPSRRLRFALLTPRLIAPHPNRGHDVQLQPEEAVALVMRGRTHDWERIAEHRSTVPSPAQAIHSKEWQWRFAGTLCQRAESATASLVDLIDDAPSDSERVAAAVAAACRLSARDDQASALRLLLPLTLGQRLSPVDRSWVLVQLARFQAEIGEVESAVLAATRALEGLASDPDDLTAAALTASAGQLIWMFSSWTEGNLEEVINRGDTPATWWRSQERGTAYADFFDGSFDDWAKSSAVTWSVVDEQVRGLASAATLADLAGDHGAWCADTAAIARLRAMRGSTVDSRIIEELLDDLRRVGDVEGVRGCLRRIADDGPLEAIQSVTSHPAESWWTRTSVEANLELWRRGADLMAQDDIVNAVGFCIGAMTGHDHVLRTRTRPRFVLAARLLPALASLLSGAQASQHKEVERLARELLAEKPENALVRSELRLVALRLNWEPIDQSSLGAWLEIAEQGSADQLEGIILRKLSAVGVDAARTEILSRAKAGNWDAVAGLDDYSVLGTATAGVLLGDLAGRISNMTEAARANAWGIGMSTDDGALAVALSIAFPANAIWDQIVELVTCPVVTGEQKAGAVLSLAARVADVPEEVRDQLSRSSGDVAKTNWDPFCAMENPAGMAFASSRLNIALGLVNGDALERQLTDLLRGDSQSRALAAALLTLRFSPQWTSALAALLGDPDPDVRSETAFSIGVLLRVAPNDTLIANMAKALCASEGRSLPFALLTGLARDEPQPLPAAAARLIAPLKDHLSWSIRRRTSSLLATIDAPRRMGRA